MATAPPFTILVCCLSGHITSLSTSISCPGWFITILERQLVALARAAPMSANSVQGSEGVSADSALLSRPPLLSEFLEQPAIINALLSATAAKQRLIFASPKLKMDLLWSAAGMIQRFPRLAIQFFCRAARNRIDILFMLGQRKCRSSP